MACYPNIFNFRFVEPNFSFGLNVLLKDEQEELLFGIIELTDILRDIRENEQCVPNFIMLDSMNTWSS